MQISVPQTQHFSYANIDSVFTLDPSLERRLNAQYAIGGRLQSFVDSEYIRTSQPYVPLLSGILAGSATRNTILGSGIVRFNTPYAREQFYGGREAGTSMTGERRGRQWHERWKADNINTFMESVEAYRRRMS